MLRHLHITREDEVAEFAPGLGITAKMVLENNPKSYIAIEKDEQAARQVRQYLQKENTRCILGDALDTQLPSNSVDVLYGEAILTMQSSKQKEAIIEEVYRILRTGGRYGIHEICIQPNDLDEGIKSTIRRDLANAIRVNTKPLTITEWKELMESKGFKVNIMELRPMHLLEPKRIVNDEGLKGFVKIVINIITNSEVRKRVLQMRGTFKKHEKHLSSICLVMEKK